MHRDTDSASVPASKFAVDQLQVLIFDDPAAMSRAAAKATARHVHAAHAQRSEVAMVFASAPSQTQFLHALAASPDLPWTDTTVFHLDEYAGLAQDAPQSFVQFLREHLFDHVPVRAAHFLNGTAPHLEMECDRYEATLERHTLDVACIGIGENGHIAFNEPNATDFSDQRLVRAITLDRTSRVQQVHDGCFENLEDVPEKAITLTVPAIMSARYVHCIVPGARKADAVRRALEGPVAPDCPASVLRRHPRATLYLDRASASGLQTR